MDFMKIKNLLLSKGKLHTGRKYLQYIYATKALYPIYVMKS